MTGFEELGLAGVAATLLFQVAKWAYRKWVAGDPDYDFHEAVYFVGIPALAFFMVPALAWLGAPGYEMPVDWVVWVKEGVLVTVSMLGTYFVGVNPLKEYRKAQVKIRNGGS